MPVSCATDLYRPVSIPSKNRDSPSFPSFKFSGWLRVTSLGSLLHPHFLLQPVIYSFMLYSRPRASCYIEYCINGLAASHSRDSLSVERNVANFSSELCNSCRFSGGLAIYILKAYSPAPATKARRAPQDGSPDQPWICSCQWNDLPSRATTSMGVLVRRVANSIYRKVLDIKLSET